MAKVDRRQGGETVEADLRNPGGEINIQTAKKVLTEIVADITGDNETFGNLMDAIRAATPDKEYIMGVELNKILFDAEKKIKSQQNILPYKKVLLMLLEIESPILLNFYHVEI